MCRQYFISVISTLIAKPLTLSVRDGMLVAGTAPSDASIVMLPTAGQGWASTNLVSVFADEVIGADADARDVGAGCVL